MRANPTGYRWRGYTTAQAVEISKAYRNGVSAKALAAEYHLSPRTIYRAIERAPEQTWTARVGGYRATFILSDEGPPVQVSQWYPE